MDNENTTEVEQEPDSLATEVTDTESMTEVPEEPQSETFPREVVEKLRQENGKYRQRAQRADELAGALWHAKVTATGRLADATDLPMPEGADPLDLEAVTAAVDKLLEAKPHLASRRPVGDIGQGQHGNGGGEFSLLGMLKERT